MDENQEIIREKRLKAIAMCGMIEALNIIMLIVNIYYIEVKKLLTLNNLMISTGLAVITTLVIFKISKDNVEKLILLALASIGFLCIAIALILFAFR